MRKMQMINHCPGQDKRNWASKDVYECPCPFCGYLIEFWKDDVKRKCKNCGKVIKNLKKDLGCAEWCKSSDKCIGKKY